ncbi:Uncharacterised protein [uncultured archaeon]|nr:Uncharacterised protein [uncultured archaeon]
MTNYRELSTIEIASLYLNGDYEFPLLKEQTYADLRILRRLNTSDENLFLREKSFSQLKSEALELLSDIEEPDSDEILRQMGFCDSTDKRCCINRKTR